MEAFKDPQVWSAALTGIIIVFLTISTRFSDSNKHRMKMYKKDSALKRKLEEYVYDVHTTVMKHNKTQHPDGENHLDIPPIPGDGEE